MSLPFENFILSGTAPLDVPIPLVYDDTVSTTSIQRVLFVSSAAPFPVYRSDFGRAYWTNHIVKSQLYSYS